MKYKNLLIFSWLILAVFSGYCQQQINYQNAKPSTPEVASFAKNVDIPMNYSTGAPVINIPLYSAKSGEMEIPVSLSYNASGLRVEEAATWVGLGWSLSTGPNLSRVVRGLPDESPGGYMHTPSYYSVKHIESLPHEFDLSDPLYLERWDFEVNVYPNGGVDLEPDIFSFSAMGYSGKFFWNQDSNKFIFSPYQNIKINNEVGFALTLPNGVKCQFGGPENEVATYSVTTSYVDGYTMAPVDGALSPYISSWTIKEMYDPTGKKIEFFYGKDILVREFGRGGETRKNVGGGQVIMQNTASFYKQDNNKPILQKISADNCDIIFKRHATIREDVANEGKSLDTIVIKDKNGIELKSFLFKYGYFISPDSTLLWGLEQYIGIARKRLFLKSVQEFKSVITDSLPAYQFTYNSTELPSRLSTSQDYWGYYNGKSNGLFLMPRIPKHPYIPFTDIFINPLATDYSYAGADRRIDSSFTQARILTGIKYPTGGITSYFYEPNRVPVWQFDPQASIEQPDLIKKSYTFMPLLYAEPPYPRDYAATFTITRPLTQVLVTPTLPPPCEPYYNNASCLYTITITNTATSTVMSYFSITVPFYLYLPEGNYTVACHVAGGTDDPIGLFTVRFDWAESPELENFMVGGLRIKKIISEDALGNSIARSFSYNLPLSPLTSSGFLGGFPTHCIKDYNAITGDFKYIQWVSNSSIPLSNDGKLVNYSYVTEFFDTAKLSFKTEYEFTHEMSTIKFGQDDGAPPTTKEWQNGSLAGKKVYEKTSSGYRILSEEHTLYQPNNMLVDLYGLARRELRPYYVATEWFVPVSTEKIEYAYPNNQQTTLSATTTSTYTDNFLLRKTNITNSKGQVIENKIWYPGDYNNVAGFNIQTLVNSNILTIPIKEETSINGKIKSGNIIKYTGDGLASEIYNYENANQADTVLHNRNLVLENNYNLKTSVFYDINRNLKQLLKTNDKPSTYIWDNQLNGITGEYFNFYPVAVVQNADSFSVAYTSFEALSRGNWNASGGSLSDNTAPTGSMCYLLTSGNIYKAGLSSSNVYIVSYWSKSGSYTVTGSGAVKTGRSVNGWTYYEHQVTGVTTVTISGSGYIDELRLFPAGAQMTSYSYKPSVGISSQCDVNNHITYYEYDQFNRLSILRDQDKNILKKICYNYAGVQENCGLGTEAQWQVINSYCEQATGNTGNLIKIEKNTNPNSSTFGNTRTVTVPNAGECPVCNISTCSGLDKKCINGICETGVKHNTSAVRINKTTWKCYYRYIWSDGSMSPEYEEPTTTTTPCILN